MTTLGRSTAGDGPPARRPRQRRGLRHELVALHRTIFRRNQRRIDAAVLGYTSAFRRYEREYERGVRDFERRASSAELERAIAAADCVYVGDYHTLTQAQRAFLRLVQRVPAGRPVTLALEAVGARRQAALDALLPSGLDGIGELLEPGSGDPETYRELLGLARARGYRVIGIDAAARGPPGSRLEARDRFAASVISRARRARPEALVMVLAGELHVAPAHLPARVRAASGGEVRDVIVYQNCESVYWALERRGLEHEVELVRVRRGEYCLLNTPPVVCQQSFLNWLDTDDELPELEAPEARFKEYARAVAGFFELPLGDALDEIEVASVADLSFMERLRRRGDLTSADLRAIRDRVLASESYYIPRARMVYLGRLAIDHASEEATHFLRHVCAGGEEPKTLVDSFYARCLEEAVAFLGSKLINHRRECPHLPYFERLAASRGASADERALARLVLLHARMEAGKRVRGLGRVYRTDARSFDALTHLLGYRLGDKLYHGLVSGEVDKREVRALFFARFAEQGAAMATYLYLVGRTRDVQLPERR